MRAVVYDQIGRRPEVRDLPDPRLPPDGVLVRVIATGLCRSDWHAWAGHDDIALPHVPGHEFAGTVAAVGADVRRWRVGDVVTAPFVSGCGRCEWCLAGNAQVCPHQRQPGFTDWGSFAELVAVHAADTNLVGVPEAIDPASAASLGCRFATAHRALVARAQLDADEWLVVVGAGGVGLSSTMIARARGARVVVVDRSAEALQLATRHGATHTVLSEAGADVPALVTELTGGGAHVSMDAVGTEQTCADAINALRRRGRHVQVGLLPDAMPRTPLPRVVAWELDVLGSHGMAASDYPDLMALVASGSLRPQDLVQRTVGLEDAAALLTTMASDPLPGMMLVDPTR